MYAGDVASYRSIIRHITPALQRPGSKGVYPVAVIFGSPACKAMKEDILPSLAYFNFRSGEALDMFCVGYTVPEDTMLFAPENFDQKAFQLAIVEFEERSSWEYSGETDLLLLNAYQYEEAGRKHVDLDFGSVFKLTWRTRSRMDSSGVRDNTWNSLCDIPVTTKGTISQVR